MKTRWTACALYNLFSFALICVAMLPRVSAAQDNPRVGLVLSGGGARGAAHIGVLKVLEREHIPVHCIAGTSFGALVGGLYAIGYSPDQIERIFAEQNWEAIFSDAPDRRLSPLLEHKNARYQGQLFFQGFSPELPTGVWGGQRLIEILNALTTERMIAARYEFDRLPIPFRTVATDLVTGRPYVFRNGPMTEAVRASVAIPMVFTPVEKGDMLLVDGGLVANLPVDLAREMGARIIIAVDVTSPLLKKEEIRSFFDVIDQSLSLAMRQTVDGKIALADTVIRPNLDGFTFRDYTRLPEIVKRGENAAERALPDLKALLAGIPPRIDKTAAGGPLPIVSAISFQGLQHVPSRQLRGEVKTRVGEPLDPEVLRSDLSRLYATRLFDRVDSNVEHVEGDRYRLNYVLTEAPLNTLGASIRYDSDYKFVALAELTARQLFNSYSSATLSSQFGGFQDHRASLRFVPAGVPFLFVEPSVHVRRRERLDVRNERQQDQYTDRRVGGQLVVGGTFLKRLEVELGYRSDRITVQGGTPPLALPGAQQISGITLRLNRDTLNAQEFPTAGLALRFQVDRRDRSLGSDVSYWKYQMDANRFLPLTPLDTLDIRLSGGYSRGEIPFYDRFYAGGFNFSDGAARQLLGYGRDEFLARQMGIAGVSYRRQVLARPLGFARRAFLTAGYNIAALSDQDRSPYRFNRYHGFGMGIAIDTVLGPARFTGGWGESSRFNFHISLGPAF